MKHKIIVLQGIPASGKSTFAIEWVKEDPEHRVRFNRDSIRNMCGVYWVPSREKVIDNLYYTFMDDVMLRGYDIVLDNMNLNLKTIEEIEKYVKDFNDWIKNSPAGIEYEIEYKTFFDIDLETCIERDSKRENPIGEKIIRGIYERYKNTYGWK